jgi:hypothetical protein
MPKHKNHCNLFVVGVIAAVSLSSFQSQSIAVAQSDLPYQPSTPDEPAAELSLSVAFPFSDSFDSATISASWLTTTTGVGQAQVSSNYQHSGSGSVFLGQGVAGSASSALILPVDLTGNTDVYLDFWWRAVGNAPEPANGVYISDDNGASWVRIKQLNANSKTYSHELLNIASAAQANGKSLNASFRIRLFFQGTFFSAAGDGLVVDEFRLSQRAGLVAAFPLPVESFETSTFPLGFYPKSSGKGGVQLNLDYPHSGTKSVFLGQSITGDAFAALDLAIDLTSQTDVFLDFWWRATGNAPEEQNGVYISDDDGVTWTRIRSLDANSPNYSHELINIASAAQANGKTLNSRFRIRLSFQGTFFSTAGDGLAIDDLQLTTRANELASFPYMLDSFESGMFQLGTYPGSSDKGGALITSDYPRSGARSLRLYQPITGEATAAIGMAVNLSGQSQVFFDFWWRATGNAKEPNNGVYISDNDGTTWTRVRQLNTNVVQFRQEVIDIAKVAAQNGKTLNDKFRIRIYFVGTFFSAAGDGLVVDDMRLGAADPSSKVYAPIVRK